MFKRVFAIAALTVTVVSGNIQPAFSRENAAEPAALVFSRGFGSEMEVFALRKGQPQPMRVTRNDSVDADPAWSPDGRRLVVCRDDDLFVLSADGTIERRLTATEEWESQPAWSPDGTHIAFVVESGGIDVMRMDGSGRRRLASVLSH